MILKIMKTKNLLIFLLLVLPFLAKAQERDSLAIKSKYDKKLLISPYFINAWSTFKGDNHPDYFAKPSLGIGVKVDFYPLPFVGVSAGIGFQQRGTGVYTPDVDKSLGNPDSTHRLRMRLNCVEVPIELLLRMPHGIKGGGVRPSATVGVVVSRMFEANEFFHSVEDGFHLSTDRTNSYYSSEVLMTAALGVDINAVGSILQVHALVQSGSKNVFNDSALYPGFNGKNLLYGVRFRISF